MSFSFKDTQVPDLHCAVYEKKKKAGITQTASRGTFLGLHTTGPLNAVVISSTRKNLVGQNG